MKEKPILFSTEMVKAIKAGNKTQTRRVMKPQPEKKLLQSNVDLSWFIPEIDYGIGYKVGKTIKCPYQVGQTLWVRETFTYLQGIIIYKADFTKKDLDIIGMPIWKPSIFMPRKAARLFSKVNNIRVERVQDITQKDIYKEGIPETSYYFRNSFIRLWDSINEKRGYGWDRNPCVWVYDFEVIK